MGIDDLLKEKREEILAIALIQELEELLKRRVDVTKPENLHKYIRNRVLQEAITL